MVNFCHGLCKIVDKVLLGFVGIDKKFLPRSFFTVLLSVETPATEGLGVTSSGDDCFLWSNFGFFGGLVDICFTAGLFLAGAGGAVLDILPGFVLMRFNKPSSFNCLVPCFSACRRQETCGKQTYTVYQFLQCK